VAKHAKDAALPAHLRALAERWAALPEFTKEGLESALRSLADERALKAGVLIHPVRAALSGAAVGPPLFDLVAAMGRPATLRHLDHFAAVLSPGEAVAPEASH
jgi:glutamyl-tRNA synthetase